MTVVNLTENESVFCQALAMTTLLSSLIENRFLDSDYYKNMPFTNNESNCRKILEASSLGNPATLQMYLYILLVMPNEVLQLAETCYLEGLQKEFNVLIAKDIDGFQTTYNNEVETDLTGINFYRHIRNAVAHSRCSYHLIDGKNYVLFTDVDFRDVTQYCKIKIATSKLGHFINFLQIQMMNYLNTKWNKHSCE